MNRLLVGAVAIAALCCACAPAVDPEALLNDLSSTDVEARLEAGQKVDKMIAAGDYEVFLRGLKSASLLNRAQSIVLLARVDRPDARKALRQLLAVDARMMLPFNPIRMRPATETSDSRILVANLIQRQGGDPEAIKVLITGAVETQSAEVLTGTCFAIGALRDPAGIGFLDRATQNADVGVVRAAVQALGQFKEPEAEASLGRLLTHPILQVRTDLLTALGGRDDAASTDLVKRMGQSDPAPDLRVAAFQYLANAKGDDIVRYFIDRLKDAPPEARPVLFGILEQRTRQQLGSRPEAWEQWWARQSTGARPAR
jgi:hypothetical protein